MADLVLGNVDRIFKVASAIKTAVDTAKENSEDCVKMAQTAANVSAQIQLLKEDSTALEDPSTSDTLKRMEETLERALELVNEYLGKNVLSRFFNAMGTSKKLRRIEKQISTDLDTLDFANGVKIRRILEQQQQYAGQVQTSQSTHSRTDQARSTPANSEKGKAVVARKRRDQSELLSGVAQFNLSQLKDACNDFSKDSVVNYYKGVLSNGVDVTIKKLSISDDLEERRLQQKLKIRAKLQHGNIVKLLGYCLDSQQEGKKLYFLVEEYIPNVKSLKRIINDSRLDWPSCFKIIQGIAKALYCLHQNKVLYMDLNPDDIFVRSDMNPVIIDFESSIVLETADDKITVEALLTGTAGYVATEKLMHGSASLKSDVFSFGVILIEIITGKKLSPLDDLPEWGSLDEMIRSTNGLFDPAQANESQLVKINRCREVGLKCIERDPKYRPTMAHVLEMLSS